jgi:hypothetical protein
MTNTAEERGKAQATTPRPDEALGKGAVEQDAPNQEASNSAPGGNNSLSGQLGHRDQDDMLKDNDTDFPEPDALAEHSGG